MASGLQNREQFRRSLHVALVDATREAVVHVQKQITLHALNGCVENTPVDRGDARGGWQASIGQPSDSLGARDPDGTATKAAGAAVVAGLDAKQPFVAGVLREPRDDCGAAVAAQRDLGFEAVHERLVDRQERHETNPS